MASVNQLSVIPLGDIGTVTKNMFLYETDTEILIVDCGIGFPDESIPGVDLLIPDVTYLKETKKKIVGLVLTHGHEDHIGAVPFVTQELEQDFPVYGTPLTAAFTNEKFKDFGIQKTVNTVNFQDKITLGKFNISFVRVTHSVVDAANLIIDTPIGKFYHGSDYKFDLTPVDGNQTEFHKIAKAGEEGVLALFSDCLGAIKKGHSKPEKDIEEEFSDVMRDAKGKVFVSTYSSNISRLNQAIQVGLSQGRKICFMGRSFLKSRDVGRQLRYLDLPQQSEIQPHQVGKMDPKKVLILAAGSQGQVDSAMSRVANNEDRNIFITKDDTVIFSSDPIPGNEANVYNLIDTIALRGAKIVHSDTSDEFHVSGHGASNDIKLMIALTKPKFLMPIGGTYHHMVDFRELAKSMGHDEKSIIVPQNAQEIVFTKDSYKFGRKIKIDAVFVDQITGTEMEKFVVYDRVKISKEGMMIVLVEVDPESGKLTSNPDVISRGFNYPNMRDFTVRLKKALDKDIGKGREEFNIRYYRKLVQRNTENILSRERRQPMVVPVILEV